MCSNRAYRNSDETSNDLDLKIGRLKGEPLLEEFFAERNHQLEFMKVMNRIERLKQGTDSDVVDDELQHVLDILDRCKFYEEGSS